jgi:ribose transport system substrate-binding protein
VLEQRNQGFIDVMKQERPGLKPIVFDAKQSPTDNFNTWSAQVKAHPDAIAYVGPGSQAAVSLSRIQRRTGQKLLVGACDLDKVAMEGVKDGLVKALISPEHWLKGYLAIKLMADAKLEDKPLPEGVWNSGALTVNADNIDEILTRQESPETRSDYFKDEVEKQLSSPDQYLSG